MTVSSYLTPLSLFREGLDTQQIADKLGCAEATVYSLLHHEREKERTKAARDEHRRQYQRRRYRLMQDELWAMRTGRPE